MQLSLVMLYYCRAIWEQNRGNTIRLTSVVGTMTRWKPQWWGRKIPILKTQDFHWEWNVCCLFSQAFSPFNFLPKWNHLTPIKQVLYRISWLKAWLKVWLLPCCSLACHQQSFLQRTSFDFWEATDSIRWSSEFKEPNLLKSFQGCFNMFEPKGSDYTSTFKVEQTEHLNS